MGGHAGAGRGSGAARRGNRGSGGPGHRASARFSPSPYDFGPVGPGQSAVKTFTLTTQAGRPPASCGCGCPVPLPSALPAIPAARPGCVPAGRARITVRFAPSEAGRVTATLTAASKGGPRHAATASDVLTGGQALGTAPGQIYWVSTDEIWAANLDGSGPHAIVTGQIGAEGIAVNSSHLYWADAADGTIWEANLDGSSPHTILTSQRGQVGLAVTSSNIYWANDGGGADRAGTIWVASLDGSSPHAIVTGQTLPSGVAADASHVYWADEGDETAGNGTIIEANPDGSSPHAIVTGQTTPSGVAVDASHLDLGQHRHRHREPGPPRREQPARHPTRPTAVRVRSDASYCDWASTDGDGPVTRPAGL